MTKRQGREAAGLDNGEDDSESAMPILDFIWFNIIPALLRRGCFSSGITKYEKSATKEGRKIDLYF
jgi:hypothetical protein